MMLAAALNSPVLTGVGFFLTIIASACIVIVSARLFGLAGLLYSAGLITVAVCIIAIMYAGRS